MVGVPDEFALGEQAGISIDSGTGQAEFVRMGSDAQVCTDAPQLLHPTLQFKQPSQPDWRRVSGTEGYAAATAGG